MTITGRLTRDAVVNTLKDGRRVVNFIIAVNDRYHSKKEGQKVKQSAYFHCAYWKEAAIAKHLKKGTLVQVEGRVFATAFITEGGAAKASLNCHTNHIQLMAFPRELSWIGKPTVKEADPDDLPF